MVESIDAQIQELKAIWPGTKVFTEGTEQFYRLPAVYLKPGSDPRVCDVLLCGHARDGKPSRLYFPKVVTVNGETSNNWNTQNAYILGDCWAAYSLNVDPTKYTLAQIAAIFLKELK